MLGTWALPSRFIRVLWSLATHAHLENSSHGGVREKDGRGAQRITERAKEPHSESRGRKTLRACAVPSSRDAFCTPKKNNNNNNYSSINIHISA